MNDDERSIELQVQVPGTPEQVWEAIATGPGISSWYVPHEVEPRAGGAMTASFGAAPELQVHGRVAAWEPPRRVVFDGGEGAGGLAFEWLVEAADGGSCIVRLVNSGFGSGEQWDAQYDGMAEGWVLFLGNLRLHLEHFAGQRATAMLPMAPWPGSKPHAWASLTGALGIPEAPQVGSRVVLNPDRSPSLAGTVVEVGPTRLALLIDEPAPGTGIVAVERHGEASGVSIWAYLYAADGATAAARDLPLWQQWLTEQAMG